MYCQWPKCSVSLDWEFIGAIKEHAVQGTYRDDCSDEAFKLVKVGYYPYGASLALRGEALPLPNGFLKILSGI